MRTSRIITTFAIYFTCWYPNALAVAFLSALLVTPLPAKGAFLARALVAVVLATYLAHVNRIYHLWPAHLLFPSGHTTFCLGLSISLAMLYPWTLRYTLPLLVVLAVSMVYMRYHTPLDIAGAIPLVILIYGAIHAAWRLPSDSPLLDRAKVYL